MPAASEPSAVAGVLALLRSRRFGPYVSCNFLSNIGSWMQLVAEPWLLLSLSGSAFLVGLDSFMLNGPILLLTLVGGALADRRDRRAVILVFQSIQMLCPLALVLLILVHGLQPWMIIALSLIVGITDALSMPAFQSIVPLIVEKKEIGSAIALNSMGFNLSRVAGPAIAGWLMAQYGPIACFGANALSYIPFILVAFLVLPPFKAKPLPEIALAPIKGSEFLSVWRNPSLLGAAASVFFMSSFCGPVLTFSAVIVKSVLHGQVGAFGNALAIFGIGGILGAGLLLLLENRLGKRRLCSGSAILFGLVLIAISCNHSRPGLFGLMFLSGTLMTMVGTSANSIFLQNAHGALLGQAAAFYMIAMRGGLAAGNLLAGALVGKIGILPFLFLSGGIAVLLQLAIAILWRRHRLHHPPSLHLAPRSPTT